MFGRRKKPSYRDEYESDYYGRPRYEDRPRRYEDDYDRPKSKPKPAPKPKKKKATAKPKKKKRTWVGFFLGKKKK